MSFFPLFLFFILILPQVSELKQWGEVAKALGFGKDEIANAAAQVRQIFVKYIVPFEVYLKTTIAKDQNVSTMKSMKSMKSTKPQPPPQPELRQQVDQKAAENDGADMEVDGKKLDTDESVIAVDTGSQADATPPRKKPKKIVGSEAVSFLLLISLSCFPISSCVLSS